MNSGSVFAGEIGTSDWHTYTVMGDPVNVAARIMGKARAGEILATARLLDRSRNAVHDRVDRPIHGEGQAATPDRRRSWTGTGTRCRVAADFPIVGRHAELELLCRGGRGPACAHSGVAIEVVAEPGAGKSRLLNEFIARCQDVPRARGGAPPVPWSTRRTSLPPNRPTWHSGCPGADTRRKGPPPPRHCLSACPQLTPWSSLIGIALQLRIEPSEDVRLFDNEFRKSRLEAAVIELRGARSVTPTIVCIEDAHWMDDASADLVAALAADIVLEPWTPCYHPCWSGGGPEPDLDQSAHRRIELAPIDRRLRHRARRDGDARRTAAHARGHQLVPAMRRQPACSSSRRNSGLPSDRAASDSTTCGAAGRLRRRPHEIGSAGQVERREVDPGDVVVRSGRPRRRRRVRQDPRPGADRPAMASNSSAEASSIQWASSTQTPRERSARLSATLTTTAARRGRRNSSSSWRAVLGRLDSSCSGTPIREIQGRRQGTTSRRAPAALRPARRGAASGIPSAAPSSGAVGK